MMVLFPFLLSERAAALLALVLCLLLCGAFAFMERGSPSLRRLLAALWVLALGVGGYLRRRLRGEGAAAGPREWRLAFESLGPTYIKLGQMIASSSGLVPERYVQEFQRCLDRVPPEPWPVVQDTLRRSLGRPLNTLFSEISAEPLASASIAQVYAARARDEGGVERDLVIKVQRQRLPERVDADMRILGFGAELLQKVPTLRNGNPRGMVRQFDQTIHEELDFLREAQNLEEFNRIMLALGRTDVCAPRHVPALTTREVLTMERFRGFRVDDLEEMQRRGIDRATMENKLIAGMHAWFQSMIRYGFFHGDVHAGNLMVLDDGRLGFLDFGIIGRFSPERRRQIADYMVAFATQDFAAVAGVMARMGVVEHKQDPADLQRFAADLKEAYGPLLTRSMQQIDYGEILPKIIRVSSRHGTRLPDDFILVTRQLLYFDRYAKLLAPTLNVFSDPRLMMAIAMDLATLP